MHAHKLWKIIFLVENYKNRLRSTMEQDLLNAQSLLSIENDYLPVTEKIIDIISELSTFSKLITYLKIRNKIQDVY